MSGFAPWIEPFQEIGLINKLWRPEIDIFTNGLIALYVIRLLQQDLDKRSRPYLRGAFKKSGLVAIGCVAVCYMMYHYLIYEIDADWVWLGNVPWAVAYVIFFLSIVRMVFAGFLSLRQAQTSKQL